MKHWSGKDFEYRGYMVKINKKEGFLNIYDKRNNYLFRVSSFGHGCISEVKIRIDNLISRYGDGIE